MNMTHRERKINIILMEFFYLSFSFSFFFFNSASLIGYGFDQCYLDGLQIIGNKHGEIDVIHLLIFDRKIQTAFSSLKNYDL